jgi:hypothetical protein
MAIASPGGRASASRQSLRWMKSVALAVSADFLDSLPPGEDDVMAFQSRQRCTSGPAHNGSTVTPSSACFNTKQSAPPKTVISSSSAPFRPSLLSKETCRQIGALVVGISNSNSGFQSAVLIKGRNIAEISSLSINNNRRGKACRRQVMLIFRKPI